MKKFAIILAVVMVVLMAACTSGPAPAPVRVDLPPWINDSPPEGALWGIGVSGTGGSMNIKMTQAQGRGRTAIARDLDTRVQAMLTDYFMEAGGASIEFTESVSRQITEMRLQGSRQVNSWNAPDGAFWSLMEITIADAKGAVASVMNNQEAQFAQFKAQQALAMLDAQLAAPGTTQIARD